MSSQLTFKNDLKAFWTYVLRPGFGPRIANNRRGDGWWSDLKVHTPLRLLLKWALFLWLLNIGLLAPIAIGVAESVGAKHRINLDIPYLFLLAAVWAPIVEELLFRFGLRRPKLIFLYVPLMIYVMHNGPNIVSLGIVVLLSFLHSFPDPMVLDLSENCKDKFSSGLSKCDDVGEDIKYCQKKDKLVLLSLGGAAGQYGFTSENEADEFSKTVWKQ